MKLKFFVAALLPVLISCTKSETKVVAPTCGPLQTSHNTSLPSVSDAINTMPVTVGCGYFNQPCVSVTICKVGTGTCQTIPNVLLDTGSYGLRLFSCVVGITLDPQLDGASHEMAECQLYGDGTVDWGPVKLADVKLGKEAPQTVPIQLIDSTYKSIPTACTSNTSLVDTMPYYSGYNGILGVGVLSSHCPGCVGFAPNDVYFSCIGNTCTSAAMPAASQVTNPVYTLPVDNNGVALELPAVTATGVTSMTGTLYLGIGTQSNNIPANTAHFFQADNSANFRTRYGAGNTILPDSFIDSGSNGLFFPDNSITSCQSGFFCPSLSPANGSETLSAIQSNSGNDINAFTTNFQIGNSGILLPVGSPTVALNDIGANLQGTAFDWGFPFFLGKTVFVGIKGRNSTWNGSKAGPFWIWQ